MIVTVISTVVLLFALWMLSGYLPTRNIAMPTYTVVATHAEYEIRRYEPYVIAETPQSQGSRSGGFNELFQYISGNNTRSMKFAMTAPVLKSAEGVGQKLAMTAPVLKQQNENGGTIAFVMPPRSRLEELPQPRSPKVTLREIPGHTMAVATFSGTAEAGIIREKTERLLRALEQDGVQVCAPPTTALYNPPWTPPFMRRNEIMVEINLSPEINQGP